MENTASTPPEGGQQIGGASTEVETRDRKIALACAVMLVIGMPIGYLPGSTGDTIGLIVLSLFSLALMAFFILRLVPNERAASPDRANRTALILGVLAFVAIAGFWLAIPFALGAAAIALGLSLRESAPADARGKPTAAVVLGGLGVLASFVLLLVG